jgi:hypothetical protein
MRAFGEMVGLLWASGEYSAAIKLEEYWNRCLQQFNASLLCAYPIDRLGPEFQADGIHAILCDHTCLEPVEDAAALEQALTRAAEDVLGEGATAAMEFECPPEWGVVPRPERIILWLRREVPRAAPQILNAARQRYLQASVS